MVQIPLTIPRVSARQTKSTSVPFQCTISVVQETKFIYDIIGYNLFHLGTNQMRRQLAILIKNNLRFCKRKISCSGNTEIDWLELCLPEKYVLFINVYHPDFSDNYIFGIADEIQKNTYVFILGELNSKNKLLDSTTTGNNETTTEELFVYSNSSILNDRSLTYTSRLHDCSSIPDISLSTT